MIIIGGTEGDGNIIFEVVQEYISDCKHESLG